MHSRPARADDYTLFTRFFSLFAMPDPTPGPEWWSQNHVHATFLEDGDETVAYGHGYLLGELGYVMNLAVDPAVRRRGYGRAMMHVLSKRLSEAGARRWYLFVKDDNGPAIALYERLGFTVTNTAQTVAVSPSAIARLPADDTIAEPFGPEQDAVLERALDLPSGRLSRDRGLGFFQRLARRGDDLVGVIGFAPKAASAARFRAIDAAAMRALFEALPTTDTFRVTLEGRPDLVAALGDVEVVLSLLRMEGALLSEPDSPRGA